MSYQWYSEAIFIITIMVILISVIYIIVSILLKMMLFIYENVREYADQLLDEIKHSKYV